MSSNGSLRLEHLYDIKGRIALVTGGGTGIGWMIAQGLATNGAKGTLEGPGFHNRALIEAAVYITGRRQDVLEKAAASFEKSEGSGDIIP